MSVSLLIASPVWAAVCWTMVHVGWVGATIGFVAALVRWHLGSARPETRYGVALVFLLALAVAPILIFAGIFGRYSKPYVALIRPTAVATTSLESSTSSGRAPTYRQASRDAAFDWRVGGPTRSWLESLVALLPWIWLCGSLSTLVMLATGLIGVE